MACSRIHIESTLDNYRVSGMTVLNMLVVSLCIILFYFFPATVFYRVKTDMKRYSF